eukprot:COSAG05_NODE_2012_length_3699_cov_7.187778_2_plen_85_part_00
MDSPLAMLSGRHHPERVASVQGPSGQLAVQKLADPVASASRVTAAGTGTAILATSPCAHRFALVRRVSWQSGGAHAAPMIDQRS